MFYIFIVVYFSPIFGCVSFSCFQMELLSRAEGLVKETAEYHCLQSQFSVLYNESLILKAQLDETRARLNTTRTARLRQLEHMEVSYLSVCVYVSYCGLFVLSSSWTYVCRTMRWLCKGRFVQRCFSWRTRWLRSGRSMRCCALNLNRL